MAKNKKLVYRGRCVVCDKATRTKSSPFCDPHYSLTKKHGHPLIKVKWKDNIYVHSIDELAFELTPEHRQNINNYIEKEITPEAKRELGPDNIKYLLGKTEYATEMPSFEDSEEERNFEIDFENIKAKATASRQLGSTLF